MRVDPSFSFEKSADLLADKRYAYGIALGLEGDWAGAADLFAQALERAPAWPAAHVALADALVRIGRIDAAAQAFRAALRLDPQDRLGAGPRLAALGLAPVPSCLPQAYVRSLFDQYAARFDAELVEGLGYRAPWRLRDLLLKELAGRGSARLLDLGCGTGLMGEAMRRHVSWLVGLDLSAEMIATAAAKQVYDELFTGDAMTLLDTLTTPFDIMTAADVLVYMGDLRPLLAQARRLLLPGGHFAFTCERGEGDGFQLGSALRYSHGEAYLRGQIAAAGLELVTMEEGVCRQERGEGVAAFFVLAISPSHAGPGLGPEDRHGWCATKTARGSAPD